MTKCQEISNVLANEEVAPNVYVITLTAPYAAKECQPGQFVHIRLPHNHAEILRLPFSVYDVSPQFGAIEIMYQVLGTGTQHLASTSLGDTVDIISCLGHGWTISNHVERALLVSGGLGAAPLNMLARTLRAQGAKLDIVMGAPSAARLVARDRLEQAGRVFIATDDGSEGLCGFCTDLSSQLLDENHYDYVATCGPEPMQRKIAQQSAEHEVFCEVSLERLMACGVGACLSCVVQTKHGQKRACTDGPVFDAGEVCWDVR